MNELQHFSLLQDFWDVWGQVLRVNHVRDEVEILWYQLITAVHNGHMVDMEFEVVFIVLKDVKRSPMGMNSNALNSNWSYTEKYLTAKWSSQTLVRLLKNSLYSSWTVSSGFVVQMDLVLFSSSWSVYFSLIFSVFFFYPITVTLIWAHTPLQSWVSSHHLYFPLLSHLSLPVFHYHWFLSLVSSPNNGWWYNLWTMGASSPLL